jgi:hypothetical protein
LAEKGRVEQVFSPDSRQSNPWQGGFIVANPSKKRSSGKAQAAGSKSPVSKVRVVSKRQAPGFTAKAAKEITATFVDRQGLTARVAAAVAGENVNILAATGYSASAMRRKATFTLIVNDIVKVERALEKIGAEDIHESSVVVVETPNRVGALARISKLIADAGINIYYFYSTSGSAKTAICVFKTEDDKKTMKILREA